jgi:hypothetical protein
LAIGGVTVPAAAENPGPIDLSDRREVREWFREWWPRGSGWLRYEGDVIAGIAGTTSADYKEAVRVRVNTLRRLAGLEPVELKPEFNALAQTAAMMVSINHSVELSPASRYYDAAASEALNSALVAGGFEGTASLSAYLNYPSPHNELVPYRLRLLAPGLKFIGTGDVPRSQGPLRTDSYSSINILYLDTTNQRPISDPAIHLWPRPGHFPHELVPGRWSLSTAHIPETARPSLAGANIEMTRNGTILEATYQSRSASGDRLTWSLDGTRDGIVQYAAMSLTSENSFWGEPFDDDVDYRVRVSNIREPDGRLWSGTGVLEYRVIGFNVGIKDPAPVITRQPVSQVIRTGDDFILAVEATGAETYQWSKDGVPIPEATRALFTATHVQAADAGGYTCTVSSGTQAAVSAAAKIHVLSSEQMQGVRITNVSTRAYVSSGEKVQIAGFAIRGDGMQKVLIRAAGPALQSFGISEYLPNPRLRVHGPSGEFASNNDWAADTIVAQQLKEAAVAAGAFAFPEGSKDAALALTLAPGNYTAIVEGEDGNPGIALVEVYALKSSGPARLVNISTRSMVGKGDAVQIAGFYISGGAPKRLLLRASGPGLAPHGVSETLSDPWLKLYDGDRNLVTLNNDWSSDPVIGAEIDQVRTSVGAFEWPTGSTDAAVLVTLAPGAYTAVVSGGTDWEGIALVEVYEAN